MATIYYKGFRLEVDSLGLSVHVWKDSMYLNMFGSVEAAKKAIARGQFDNIQSLFSSQ